MLDAALIRTQPDMVREKIATKNVDPSLVDRFIELDSKWRSLTTEVDELRAKQKELSAARDIEGGKQLRDQVQEREVVLRELEAEREVVWRQIPNLPSDDTPIGKDDTENTVIRSWGELPTFSFTPKDHLALGEALGMLNTSKASDISGARFAYLMGAGARIEFAIVQLVMSLLSDPKVTQEIAARVGLECPTTPFIPVVPPVMIRPQIFDEMARLEPREERYYIPSDDLYLIGSAEHTLGPLHRGETIPEAQLPIRYIGFSTAFRREAGSYGRDTQGILRVHQFDKLELESFSTPEQGLMEQDFFVAVQEYLMQQLEIPYRVVMCCTGDQGDPDARHMDIEAWIPSQNTYRETHSADYMTDFQSRRLKTKVKRADGSTALVHTNDATAFAIGRTLIALMENNQQEDGSIMVPKVLQALVGTDRITA
jgi:seryl-tRNA synthetase